MVDEYICAISARDNGWLGRAVCGVVRASRLNVDGRAGLGGRADVATDATDAASEDRRDVGAFLLSD